MYKQVEGKAFNLAHCWAILQEHIKWQDVPDTTSRVRTPHTGTSSSPDFSQIPGTFVSLESDENPSPISGGSGSVQSPRKRLPTGGKKEKEAKRKSKMVEETNRAVVNLIESFQQADSEEARKEKREIAERKLQIAERKAKAMEEANANERMGIEMKKSENEMKAREYDAQVMSMDLSKEPDPQKRRYFAMLKGEIMEKMMARQQPEPYFPDFDFTEP